MGTDNLIEDYIKRSLKILKERIFVQLSLNTPPLSKRNDALGKVYQITGDEQYKSEACECLNSINQQKTILI